MPDGLTVEEKLQIEFNPYGKIFTVRDIIEALDEYDLEDAFEVIAEDLIQEGRL